MNPAMENTDVQHTDKTDSLLFNIIITGILLFGLSLTHLYSYLLFHALSEFFSIVVGGCVFLITWNSRYLIKNNYLLVIGVAYLFISGIDLIHALTYSGMGIVKGYGNNLPTQLWVAGRYMESMSLLFAPLMINRRLNLHFLLAFFIAVTALICLSIFKFHIFPDCYIDKTGLTLFKTVSEYIISFILLMSLILLITKKEAFDRNVHHLLIAVILTTIVSEIMFAFYFDVYGTFNLLGHLFKVISFYLLYKAVIETSFKKPYAMLLRDLHKREMDRDNLIAENKKQKEFLEKVMHEVPVGIAVVRGADHRYDYVNPYYQSTLGTKNVMMTGMSVADVFPDAIAASMMEMSEKVYQTKQSVRIREYEASVGPGREKTYWDMDHIPLLNDRDIEGVLMIVHEITNRVLTRKRLETMIAGQKAILENLNEGLIIADPEGNLTDINFAGHKLLQMDKTKTIGRHRSAFFDMFEVKNMAGDFISPEEGPMEKILNHEKFTDFELQMRHKLTDRSWFASFSGTPVYNEMGEFILAVLVMRDITDQKLAENELKQSHDVLEEKAQRQAIELENERKRFYFVLEHLPAFVCLIGPDYSVPYANQYFKNQFGDPAGKTCYHMKHNNTDVCDFCPVSTVKETNTPKEWDWIDSPDEKIYHLYAYPFKDIDGTQMILEMGIDITQRIKDENKLKRYSRELELRNQELQDFAYVASHDLQEPLRKIQTFGSRIRDKYFNTLDETAKDYLMRMENAATRMRALITALLDYSRISTRGEDFRKIDLNKVISQTLNDMEDLIHRKNARLEIDNLPAIEADPNQIHQLFQNLISNGIKFNDHPVPLIRIHGKMLDIDEPAVDSLTSRSWCRIFVEDNGIGFDEKYTETIFTPFQRLHSQQKYKGTGIGLAVCRKVIERHSGTITVKSTPGAGTTFIITLPANQIKTIS